MWELFPKNGDDFLGAPSEWAFRDAPIGRFTAHVTVDGVVIFFSLNLDLFIFRMPWR
jgi:hypothetical protein